MKHLNLINWMERKMALSPRGAHNFLSACLWTGVQNLSFMLPVMLVYLLMMELFGESRDLTLWALVGMALLSIIGMYLITRRQYNSTFLAVYSESATMRIRLAEKMRRLPLSFFDRHDASDLTSRVMSDVSFLENAYSHTLPQMVASFIVLILAGCGLASLDWRLALALFWAAPVSLLILWGCLASQKRSFVKASKSQLSVSEKVEEGLQLHQTIKAYGGETLYMTELDAVLASHERTSFNTELASFVVVNGLRSLLQLAIPTLVIVGSHLYLAGEVSLGILLFFLLISVSVYTPLTMLMANALVTLFASVRIDRMNEIYNMPTQEGRTDFAPKSFDLTFEDVSFSYNEGAQVLSHVSFTAKQGEVTALVGPSGGGKSTCARLASRFWDCQSGTVSLGGEDLTAVDTETLLKYYAIVFQDVVLFNNTVLENIRVGRKEATDAEVLEAARLAQCDDFVARLPEGYQTQIGENGSRLSGGERQRISIARAILKNAPIIILDEATASQDAESETHIQRALSQLTTDKTVLIIAHRMRTIRNADRIVVLSGGTVAASGTPDELYDVPGYYRTACDLQRVES